MSEFRRNTTNGEWVIVAPERMRRPNNTRQNRIESPIHTLPEHDPDCPFCPGGATERNTPLYSVEEDGRWLVRSIPNKFAAVSRDVNPSRGSDGFNINATGYGSAEVIIESPLHNTNLTHMTFQQVKHVLECYKHRFLAMAEDDNIQEGGSDYESYSEYLVEEVDGDGLTLADEYADLQEGVDGSELEEEA